MTSLIFLQDMDQTTEFEKLIERKPDKTKKVLSLFNNFLCKKYPDFIASKKFSVEFLLAGQLWSNVIRLFGEYLGNLSICDIYYLIYIYVC